MGLLVHEDTALTAARRSGDRTTMPGAGVAPNYGKLLYLLAKLMGARRVLEFGTLAGYSTIWLARAVGPSGRVITLESEPLNAATAGTNLVNAGVSDWVDVITGPANRSAAKLVAAQVEPFDLFFIDADKRSNPEYLAASLQLARPGSVIVGDNVVREGQITDPETTDPSVQGVRSFLELVAADPRLEATAIQVVGSKGWDGFSVAIVRD